MNEPSHLLASAHVPSSITTPQAQSEPVRLRGALCERCGYHFRGLTASSRGALCPECGHPNAFSLPPSDRRYHLSWFIAAPILSLVIGTAFILMFAAPLYLYAGLAALLVLAFAASLVAWCIRRARRLFNPRDARDG